MMSILNGPTSANLRRRDSFALLCFHPSVKRSSWGLQLIEQSPPSPPPATSAPSFSAVIMSDTLRFHPSLTPLPPTTSRGYSRAQQFSIPGPLMSDSPRKSLFLTQKIGVGGGKVWASASWTKEGPLQGLDDSPVSVEFEPVSSDTQFDRVVGEAQQLEESVVIVWMATWCRKCIYLKPKLEKLAAEYYPRLRFYCVDVNTVPHKLVARAAVTLHFYACECGQPAQKMPTIQLWRDSKKQAEVIGGHKAYLVVNEVREMIENECAV